MAPIPALTELDEPDRSCPPHAPRSKHSAAPPVVHHLLVEAEAPLRAAFGADVTLALTIETDPEAPG